MGLLYLSKSLHLEEKLMFAHIMVPIDLQEETSWARALPVGAEAAKRDGAQLTMISIMPTSQALALSMAPSIFALRLDEMASELMALRQRFVPAAVPGDVIVREGSIYAEILSASHTLGVDLIVMASHRPAMKDYLIGTNAARVVRHAACSVMIVREPVVV
jgi:nucleotide-binding universal stress UspA family protein